MWATRRSTGTGPCGGCRQWGTAGGKQPRRAWRLPRQGSRGQAGKIIYSYPNPAQLPHARTQIARPRCHGTELTPDGSVNARHVAHGFPFLFPKFSTYYVLWIKLNSWVTGLTRCRCLRVESPIVSRKFGPSNDTSRLLLPPVLLICI